MYWQLDSRARGNMCLLGNLRWSTASGQIARGFQKPLYYARKGKPGEASAFSGAGRLLIKKGSTFLSEGSWESWDCVNEFAVGHTVLDFCAARAVLSLLQVG